MAEYITDRVSVGISACIYGCPVRYNGKAFDVLKVMGRERADFSFTPVCPECLAGFGVPRAPIHLTGTGEDVLAGRARVRDRRGHDGTEQLVAGCTSAMEALERAGVVAFIAKEASPTCGLYKARVGKRRTETAGGSGVLGAMLLARGWFLIPDEGLANPLLWWDWRRRLHAWLWLSRREMQRTSELYEAWHTVKFVIQETRRPVADDIGRSLGALPKHAPPEQLEELRRRMLEALRAPSTRPRIRQALAKSVAHAEKSGALRGVDVHGLRSAVDLQHADLEVLVSEITSLERISFENDLLVGPSPVLRRERRRILARDNEQRAGQQVPPR